MDSRIYWIWLAQALGAGAPSMGELLAQYEDAAAVYHASETALSAAGMPPKVVRCLREKSLAHARAILNRVVAAGDWVLTPADALYPIGLRQLPDRPAVLYCRSTMPDLDTHLTLGVVGTRRATQEGWRATHSLAAGLAAGGAIVVSGGAKGIDAAAHTGALDGGGLTVAVMGCPVDVEYPAENADLRRRIVEAGGLLMSEYPHGEEYRCVYPIRNRLIAGLSHGVCLGETPARSGARITARLAREQGREVFAMPAGLAGHRNDGAHREIQHGAALITDAADVLEAYETLFPGLLDSEAARTAQKTIDGRAVAMPSAQPRREKRKKGQKTARPQEQMAAKAPTEPAAASTCPEAASDAARAVYAVLLNTPQPVDELAAKTGLSIPALLAALTELEMLGCAANSAGQQYYKL